MLWPAIQIGSNAALSQQTQFDIGSKSAVDVFVKAGCRVNGEPQIVWLSRQETTRPTEAGGRAG